MANKMLVERLDDLELKIGEIHKFMLLSADFIQITSMKMRGYDAVLAGQKKKLVKPRRKRSVKKA